MRIAVFDTHKFEQPVLTRVNARFGHELQFFEPRLTSDTAPMAESYPAVCSFVNDRLDRTAIELLAQGGTRLILLRSAGFNHVDLASAAEFGVRVARVPAYSPYAVAEHAVALLLALNRKTHRAYARVREMDFHLDGLVGFDLHGKTVGVIGTGKIGEVFCRIMLGFGCRVVAYDPRPSEELLKEGKVHYVTLDELYRDSDVVSLHVPLTPQTRHMIDCAALLKMKRGAVLINTGRGGLIDAQCLIDALKDGKLGGAGLDVYEEEAGIFFQDFSESGIKDDVLARLLTFPNVLVTSHQGFLTLEALTNIAETTLENARAFEQGQPIPHEVQAESAQAAVPARR